MPDKNPGKLWADPNREGQSKGKEGEWTCSKCGNSVRKVRILKSLSLCEYCLNELKDKRDGITSCRGCGRIAPLELKEHNGYCSRCVCSACGKPDPGYVRKTGLCFQCAVSLGDFCRSCGKEAAAQVRKNKGFCDECVANGKNKSPVRRRRVNGPGTRWNRFKSKGVVSSTKPNQSGLEKADPKRNIRVEKMATPSKQSTRDGTRHYSAKSRNSH
jgi:hypothetical protein